MGIHRLPPPTMSSALLVRPSKPSPPGYMVADTITPLCCCSTSVRRRKRFVQDQKASNVSVWVVIMAPSPPSEEISALCRQPKYRSRVVYFKGSVTNPRDMSAVCAE